jgi:hypothetical protein
MRDIEIRAADTGIQVLLGYPSPRFERYLGNARRAVEWTRRVLRVLVVGPLWAFGLALAFGLADGSLRLTAGATEDLRQLRIAVQTGAGQSAHGEGCGEERLSR